MPEHSEGETENSQLLARPPVQLVVSTGETSSREKGFLVVPEWWASFVPSGYDYCNVRNFPRFALLVVLLTLVILAWQHLDSKSLEAGVRWLEKDHTLAFCTGRFLLRDWVESHVIHRFPQWAAVDSALSKEGWKLITLLRLSPIIPWNFLNYAAAITGVRFTSFTLSSALSVIPWTITLTYFGSLARSMADIFNGEAMPGGPVSYILFTLSGVMLVVLVAFATIISRQAVRAALKEGTSAGQNIIEELDRMAQVGSPSAGADSVVSPRAQMWSSPINRTVPGEA
ncbi:hypothetical protein WJX73_009469 [Symbiochloris irregularis]|uniref:VTT domain-containing protein n=1 Tax=Symbiochloris irregularis TaxID=706552 RepID=A0AAW1NRE4_9CHLO